jgi:hypothetical protein
MYVFRDTYTCYTYSAMKGNEMRHVIHDTRISSGQCPILVSVAVNVPDVTSRYGTAYKVIRNIPQRKDIYMSKCFFLK